MAANTVSNTTPKAIVGACSKAGLDTAGILFDAGIDQKTLQTSGGRVGIERVVNLWEISRQRTKDRMIGISASEATPFGSYGVIDYIILTGATPKDGLSRALRYYPLVNSAFKLGIHQKGSIISIELYNRGGPNEIQPQYVDYVFACVLNRLRLSTNTNWKPQLVSLACSRPAEINAYHRLFQSPIRFNQSANRMTAERDALEIRQPNSDPFLCEMLDLYAQNQVKRLAIDLDLLNEVRRVLLENMPVGYKSDLGTTARKLAMSRRNLQRKLSRQNTSYRRVLEQVRSEIAQHLIKSRTFDIDEIAYLLGFEEQTSFYRAFKKWTGKTLQDFLDQ
jgi:AraC-like DNA-binding protein